LRAREEIVSFAVDLTALAEVPGMLDRLAADARACHDHVAAPYAAMDNGASSAGRDVGAGLINRLGGNHARIRGEVLGFLSAVRGLAERQAGSVAEAVAGYSSVDRHTAELLDRMLPWTPVDPALERAQSLQPQWHQVRLPEPLRPAERLRPLTDHRAEIPYAPSWNDLLSPTTLARDAVWYLTGLASRVGLMEGPRDPMDDLVIPFVGDWAGMQACGEALGHLAEATRALATNAGWIAIRVEGSWLGNAADACWRRLHGLDVALGRVPDVLAEMSAAYLAVCGEIRDGEEIAEFVVTELLDWTATALLAAETFGISLMIKGADHLADLRRLVRTYDKAVGIVDEMALAVERGDSALTGLGLLDIDPELALPTVPG
jgi:hypothetical protein